MSTHRFTTTSNDAEGVLLLTEIGMEFVPSFALDGDQMGLAWDGWSLDWHDIVGVERVLAAGQVRTAHARSAGRDTGQVRVHHAGGARFRSLTIHAGLEAFLTAVDARVADPVSGEFAA